MTVSDIARTQAPRWRMTGGMPTGMFGTVLRYGLSASGPVAVSAAHFLASLIFLRSLPAHQFGLFSFVMVVVSFGMSLNVSLIVVPITRNLVTGEAVPRRICFQMNWLVCGGFAALLFAALMVGGAPLREAVLLALFAGAFTFRWFARCVAYVNGRMAHAITSDITYSLLVIGTLGLLELTQRVTFTLGSEMMLLSALVALVPFGAGFFREQAAALRGNPMAYWPVFKDLTRWSLMGVILTELTVNAHAYLVTFIAGPSAFALLALGMLLMRPAALMQSALPDLERPAMSRAIAARDMPHLSRIRRHFTFGLGAAWAANMLLCAALLLFFPALLLKKGYALRLHHGDPRPAHPVRRAAAGGRTIQGTGEHRHGIGGDFRRRDIGPAGGFWTRSFTGRDRARRTGDPAQGAQHGARLESLPCVIPPLPKQK
jgi:hypothetical protein